MVFTAAFLPLPTAAGLNPRPNPDNAAVFARWLVRESTWGVLSTVDYYRRGSPFGNAASFADNATGVPYFYLSSLDPTDPNALRNPLASFMLIEAVLGTCVEADPQSPICAKLTLSEDLELLPRGSPESNYGEDILFDKHSSFRRFPKLNGTFYVFKLEIEEIFLVNLFAPPRNLTVSDYHVVNRSLSDPNPIL